MSSRLQSLLERTDSARLTTYGAREAPTNSTKLSLLLSVCGYVVRFSPLLKVRGATGKWVRVRRPLPGESLHEFLRCMVAIEPPGRWMNSDDERLDLVFA